MCKADCGCGGNLPSDRCPLFPACDACSHLELVSVHLVRVHVHHDETLDDTVGRYVEPRTRDTRAPLMN